MSDESDRWQRRLDRERKARKEAEQLLEQKSLDLFGANEKLRQQADELERLVEARTADLGKALARAESAVRAKADFLATISHEIRTPLNGILGLSELLEMDIQDSGQLHHIGLLRKSGQTLLSLVNELLDFSKIEAGQLEMESIDFDPAEELESILQTHISTAHQKGIDLQWQLRGLPRMIRGDSLRFRQILGNLLSNALKFTREGFIRVDAEAFPTDGDRVKLKVIVSDTGIGISPDVLPRLFEPFSQADSSTTRRFGGTGLGLAIVRRLARAMSGDVTAESHLGKGSSFICDLVFSKAKAPDPQGTTSVATCGHDMTMMDILLVEDNPINQTVALRFLKKLGYHADVASSGKEALDMLPRKSYDVILMDMQMPEMDGLEATRRLREMELPKRPRVIALTANASAADQESCRLAGMDAFLSKPLVLADFRQQLCMSCLSRFDAKACSEP